MGPSLVQQAAGKLFEKVNTRWREALTIHTGEGLKVVDEFKITSAKPIEEGRSIT